MNERKVTIILLPVVCACISLILAGGGVAKASDLSAEWSDTQNPNGVWSYHVGNALGVSGTRSGDIFRDPPGPPPVWTTTPGDYTWLGWSRSNGSELFQTAGELVEGDVYGHTGYTESLAIKWTSPLAGQVTVSGGVWAIRDIDRWNDWRLALNGTVLISGTVGSGDEFSRSNPAPIDLLLDVALGDLIEFTASPAAGSTPDYIAVDLRIFPVPEPANTPQGSGIVVSPMDTRTGTTPVTLTFEQVTQSGSTTLSTSSAGPALPTGYVLGHPPMYYNTATTASYTGSIDVRISYSGIRFSGPTESLRLMRYENGQWVDSTTAVNPGNQTICGAMNSLVPLAMMLADEPVYFADASLKQAVIEALAALSPPIITTDPTRNDMFNLTQLTAVNRGIMNLTGLEYASNLTNLVLSGNQISSVGPLANLVHLHYLQLDNNRIASVSALSGLTSLEELHLQQNEITEVSGLANSTHLWRLLLDRNQIVDISGLSGLTQLAILTLYQNQISDISALSGMTQLNSLPLYNNQISDLSPLAGLTNLGILQLSSNQVSNLAALTNLTNLQNLQLNNNRIASIGALAGLVNLRTLYVNNNQISDIGALSGLVGLTDLRANGNQIGSISSLSGKGNLRTLYLSNNPIGDISPLSASIGLTDLRLQSSQISNIGALAGMTNLRYLYLNDNQISDISVLSGKASLQYLYLYNNQISSISALAAMVNLRDLRLNNNQISDISMLAGKTGLQYLYLYNNQISSISALAGLVNLRDLRLNDNQITDISFLWGNTSLQYLHLHNNQISNISALAGLVNLRELRLNGNQINDISALSGKPYLTVLKLQYNQITDMSPVVNLTALTNLDLGVNPITTIPDVSNLRNLTAFSLYSCEVNSVSDLSGLVSLEYLNLYNNHITDVSALAGLRWLKTLHLGWNQISDISPLVGLTSLELLDIRRNQFPTILPLAGLTNLRSFWLSECGLTDIEMLAGFSLLSELRLDGNQIQDISPLAGLTNAVVLWLSGNQISDISPLVSLTHLTQLDLRSNPLNTDACTTYIPEIIANNPGIQLLENVCFEPGENILTNGGFESGALAPWQIYTVAPAAASVQVVSELTGAAVPESPVEGSSCLHIVVDATGANFWAIGLQYPGLAFRAGKQYTLSAFLKSRQGTLQINFKPEHAGDPWTGYGEQVLTMTDTWARYSVTTPVFTEDVWLADVTFHIGFSVGDFWMDDVRLIEEDGPLPQVVSFADQNLKQAVKDALGITTDPTDAQMATLTELYAQNRGITDLTGIQYAGNLTLLAANGNQISNISPLTTLTTLQEIDLTGCPLGWESYCQWLPTIQANNSGLTNLQVDPNPYNCACLPEPTPEGSAVSIAPTDNTTGTAPVVLTFEQVDTPGATTLVTSTSGPEPQPGFRLGEPPIYYDLTTTASHTGLIDVCISYANVDFPGLPEALRLFHYEDGQWVDCTTMVDTQNQTVCGVVTSLSPFAIMLPPDTTQPVFQNLTATPNVLWPPTHKMIPVAVAWSVTDNRDPHPAVVLTSITMNEGDETNTYDPAFDTTVGDGHTIDDIQVDANGNIFLRAERMGTGTGRTYSLVYEATDGWGNTATATVIVTIPHEAP